MTSFETLDRLRMRITRLEEAAERLRQRLDSEVGDRAATIGSLEVIPVRVGDWLVALPLGAVLEVLPRPELTPIPDAPVWIAGVLDLRGEPIPVLDVLARFRRSAREGELTDFLVVCTCAGRTVALAVQGTTVVTSLQATDVQRGGVDRGIAPFVVGTVPVPAEISALSPESRRVLIIALEPLVRLSGLPERECA